MKKVLSAIATLLTFSAFSQKDYTEKTRPIIAEGKSLYQSEMASWYGTDLFLEFYRDKDNIGGYFSYTENEVSKCIFFSKAELPKVIGTITFDSTYNVKTANIDIMERDFSSYENDIYQLRKAALAEIRTDTMFKSYEHTNFNIVPFVKNNERKIYVLTGPQDNGIVIFGNDYLLTFDKNNKLISKRPLHKNIIPVPYSDEGEYSRETVHSHLPETGDFITSTDICTLMLYAKFAKWSKHSVVSKKYLNVWNCDTQELTIIEMDVIRKINEQKDKKTK